MFATLSCFFFFQVSVSAYMIAGVMMLVRKCNVGNSIACMRRMSCVALSADRRLCFISSGFLTKILYVSLFSTYMSHAPIIRSSLI